MANATLRERQVLQSAVRQAHCNTCRTAQYKSCPLDMYLITPGSAV
ncbi:MAG: hypothetical protein ACK48B_02515 [Dolichospermum sp.]